jgi:hypothetical protein
LLDLAAHHKALAPVEPFRHAGVGAKPHAAQQAAALLVVPETDLEHASAATPTDLDRSHDPSGGRVLARLQLAERRHVATILVLQR